MFILVVVTRLFVLHLAICIGVGLVSAHRIHHLNCQTMNFNLVFSCRFLWLHRDHFVGKRILEIGCGTALPGILAAKIGAKVILSDSCMLPESLKHTKRCCTANQLVPGTNIDIIGLTWGILLKSVFDISALDYIIAADCFYDPSVFEDILVTVSFLLNAANSNSTPTKFLFTYQERSADWSIDHLLQKWNLKCSNVSLKYVDRLCPIEIDNLMNGHEIRLLEISKLR